MYKQVFCLFVYLLNNDDCDDEDGADNVDRLHMAVGMCINKMLFKLNKNFPLLCTCQRGFRCFWLNNVLKPFIFWGCANMCFPLFPHLICYQLEY